MVLVSNDRFQRKTADIEFLIAIEAISSLVFHGAHGIVIGKVAFVFVVLGNGLRPVGLVPVRLGDEEDGFSSAFLVLGETFQYTGAFFNHLFVLLRFLASGIRLGLVRNAVQTRRTQFGRFVIEPFCIEHVIQIGTARATIQQCSKQD